MSLVYNKKKVKQVGGRMVLSGFILYVILVIKSYIYKKKFTAPKRSVEFPRTNTGNLIVYHFI